MYVPKLQITMLALAEFPDPLADVDRKKVLTNAIGKRAVLVKLGHDVDAIDRTDVSNAFARCKEWFGENFTAAQVASRVTEHTHRAMKEYAKDGDGGPRKPGAGRGHRKKKVVKAKGPEAAVTQVVEIAMLEKGLAFLHEFGGDADRACRYIRFASSVSRRVLEISGS